MQTQRLVEGNPVEVTIGAETRNDGVAALLLSTRQSIENGNALVIQSGSSSSRGPIPFNLAILSIIGAAGSTGGAGLALLVRKRQSEDRKRGKLI